MALLGEMHYSPTASDSWFNLPRENGVAYAAQESWVLNETIKVRLHQETSCPRLHLLSITYSLGLLMMKSDTTKVSLEDVRRYRETHSL